jgi:hypothetical protein
MEVWLNLRTQGLTRLYPAHLNDRSCQLFEIHRLGHVPVHAVFQELLPVTLHSIGGQGDDRDVGPAVLARPDSPRGLAACFGALTDPDVDLNRTATWLGQNLEVERGQI